MKLAAEIAIIILILLAFGLTLGPWIPLAIAYLAGAMVIMGVPSVIHHRIRKKKWPKDIDHWFVYHYRRWPRSFGEFILDGILWMVPLAGWTIVLFCFLSLLLRFV
jgi:hypothetical protein